VAKGTPKRSSIVRTAVSRFIFAEQLVGNKCRQAVVRNPFPGE
jgi:hypothetical protein